MCHIYVKLFYFRIAGANLYEAVTNLQKAAEKSGTLLKALKTKDGLVNAVKAGLSLGELGGGVGNVLISFQIEHLNKRISAFKDLQQLIHLQIQKLEQDLCNVSTYSKDKFYICLEKGRIVTTFTVHLDAIRHYQKDLDSKVSQLLKLKK